MNADTKKTGAAIPVVATVEDFVQWTKGLQGRSLLYRGLANVNWRVESAAYRRIEASEGAPENHRVFKNYTLQLLEKASNRGLRLHEGRMLFDLELLAQLQHYGAATCLIDFTYNSLVALWFACREASEENGKVVAMDSTRTDAAAPDVAENVKSQNAFQIVGYEKSQESIETFLDNKTLWQWEPLPRESRIIAQHSIFVFGKERMEDRFKAVCIPASEKSNICTELHKKFGVTEENMFSDFAGFALANAYDKLYEGYSADDYCDNAERLYRKGQLDKAMQHCNNALLENPQHVEAYYWRGRCHDTLAKFSEAAADFSRAIELDPNNAISLLWRGFINPRNLKDLQKANPDHTTDTQVAPNTNNQV